MKKRLREFVTKWEMVWHASTVLFYVVALALVVILFPDVSNLWVSIFVLFGSFTAAMAGMIAAIKTKNDEDRYSE